MKKFKVGVAYHVTGWVEVEAETAEEAADAAEEMVLWTVEDEQISDIVTDYVTEVEQHQTDSVKFQSFFEGP